VNRRRIALASAVAAAAAALLLWRERAPRVTVSRVARRELVPVVTGRGEIIAPIRIDVHPAIMGKVVRIDVAEGQPVAAGALLGELDGSPYAAQAAEADAAVRRSDADARIAEVAVQAAARKLERARALSRKKIASGDYLAAARIDLEKARGASAAAREALVAARSRLAVARQAMERVRILAPIAGTVVALRARPAETIAEGRAFATLEERDTAWARVDVRPEEGRRVAPGERAFVTVERTHRTFRGEVREAPASNKTGGFAYPSVMIAIPASAELRPGDPIRARIETTGLPGVLAVPLAGILPRAGSQADVFVAKAGRAQRRAIETGARGEREIQVVGGLSEGETVVSGPPRAVRRLDDGVRIVIVERKEE